MTQYIEIVNWDSLQHYKKRPASSTPAWIKTYTRLIHRDEYRRLTGHQRAVLHGLWILYAISHCQLALNPASLSSQLGLRVTSRQLQALSDAGFIRFYSRDIIEQKREEENIKTLASTRDFQLVNNPRQALELLNGGSKEVA